MPALGQSVATAIIFPLFCYCFSLWICVLRTNSQRRTGAKAAESCSSLINSKGEIVVPANYDTVIVPDKNKGLFIATVNGENEENSKTKVTKAGSITIPIEDLPIETMKHGVYVLTASLCALIDGNRTISSPESSHQIIYYRKE